MNIVSIHINFLLSEYNFQEGRDFANCDYFCILVPRTMSNSQYFLNKHLTRLLSEY